MVYECWCDTWKEVVQYCRKLVTSGKGESGVRAQWLALFGFGLGSARSRGRGPRAGFGIRYHDLIIFITCTNKCVHLKNVIEFTKTSVSNGIFPEHGQILKYYKVTYS